jgi:hypothetical protein
VRQAVLVAVILAWANGLHAAEPLGRLFFTPGQRATLDAGKELDKPKLTGPAVRGPRTVTVNGVVTRSDGESTVWVNGSPASNRGPAPISATPAGATAARIQVLDSKARLRVGQTLDRRTGKVSESYENKPILAAPAPLPQASAPGTDKAAGGGPDDSAEN